jgi:hypothetical protein
MENQEKLFNIKPIIVPRPDINNINIDSVYLELAEEICSWLNEEESEDEIFNYLKNKFTVNDFRIENGYELCKEMDSDGYEPDEDLVEIMSSSSYLVYKAFEQAQKDWVVKCEIIPALNIGEEVEIKYEGSFHKAKINEIKKETAQYICNIPNLMSTTSGVYVNFEDVEPDFFKK